MSPFDTVALSLTWHTPPQNEHRNTLTPLAPVFEEGLGLGDNPFNDPQQEHRPQP
jgi:hypothetical protein